MPAPSVLFINRVYPPQEGATGQLLADLTQELAGAGWRVTVVTAVSGKDMPRSEMRGGVRVERVRGLAFTRETHWRRALGYLTLYPALYWRARSLLPADVVVTMTDPPLQLFLGPWLKIGSACRLLHWAQDLYPELAEELRVVKKNGLLARLLQAVSNWALRRSDRIIAVGRCMKDRLVARGLPSEAVTFIPNWGLDPESGAVPVQPERFREQHGLTGRFVVMYSGNLGLAHSFAAILDAAGKLQDQLPEVLFLFVGQGARRCWVEEETAARRLSNVRFLPPQPREQLMTSLAAADVHLATLRENLLGLVVPSKVYGVLTSGRPCIFLGPAQSEVARVIQQAQCGRVLPTRDSQGLADCLTEWFLDRDLWLALSNRAARAARQFTLANATAVFGWNLESLVQQPLSPLFARLFPKSGKAVAKWIPARR